MTIKSLKKIYSGKVRDLYEIDQDKMLMVASDRLSAFDVILDDPIPSKGEILTTMSNKWFEFFMDDIPNHFTGDSVYDVLPLEEAKIIEKRAVVVKRLEPIKIEAVVRGYISGGGWKEYKETGSISGISLPEGLKESEKFPEIIFTPSSKALVGDHDENISFDQVIHLLGQELAEQVRNTSIYLYKKAAVFAESKDIIICDTKFEFGLDKDRSLVLMDEVLTPDSSRFWSINSYQVGLTPPSYDKQFIRNWLEEIAWNKRPPVPAIPSDIVQKTIEKYQEIYHLLFGA